jgi:predicted phage tail protein
MTNVYLHGELRNLFGECFKLNISSPKEVFSAINANKKTFANTVKKLAIKGVLYRIVIDDEVLSNPKELDVQKAPKEMHIVPVVWGAGGNSGGILMLAAGIALVAITAGAAAPALAAGLGLTTTTVSAAGVATTTLSTLGSVVASVGASLAIQGVMTLLFPQPKPDFNQEVAAGGKSYLFGNKPSNVSQGQAVPVGYGRLLVGSSQISAATNHYPLATDIKQLMTPVDKPINDYTELVSEDEAPSPYGLNADGFSTNQSANDSESQIFSSINILNSYINVITSSAGKVATDPVEVVVTTNGETVSNPDLSTYNPDIVYDWKELSATKKGAVAIETAFSFQNGLAYRSYNPNKFELKTKSTNSVNTAANYFVQYPTNTLVTWGPTEFANLDFPTFDPSYKFVRKEIAKYLQTSDITAAARSTLTVTITTKTDHGFVVGNVVDISGLTGTTNANGLKKIKATPTSNTFTYDLVSGTSTETYTVTNYPKAILTRYFVATLSGYSPKTITAASRNLDTVTVTSSSHGLSVGNVVIIEGLTGTVYPNGTRTITEVTTDTFKFVISGATSTETYAAAATANALRETQPFPIVNNAVNTSFWAEITPPTLQSTFKALKSNTGVIPNLAALGGDWASAWLEVAGPTTSPVNKADLDSLIDNFPAYTVQGVYDQELNMTNLRTITSSTLDRNSLDNYAMEFYGYLYVEIDKTKVINSYDAQQGITYEIVKIGDTGQWAELGLTGAGGAAIMPELGMTFTKNATVPSSLGNGKIYPVNKYSFKIDSDDAADLYIDGQLASSFYGNHGFDMNLAQAPEIADLSSTTQEITLTLGYHRLYARFQDGIGSDGISLYSKSKLDGGSYSSYALIAKDKLFYSVLNDLNVSKSAKFRSKVLPIAASAMKVGRKYKIITSGTTNWTAIGAPSSSVGTVFFKTAGSPTGSGGFVFEDLLSYAQQTSATSNRLVRFVSQRPVSSKSGLSVYNAQWQCSAKIGALELKSAPVKISITFNATLANTSARAVIDSTLSYNDPAIKKDK